MGLLQLEYFKALAEKEHLTQTAKDLMISAPSLSATIARLEQDLGCKLFDRDGRNIRLNKFGEIYLRYTNDILLLLENAKTEVRDLSGQKNMNLSIAISSPMVWLDVISSFIRANPDITVSHTLIKRDRFKDYSYCFKFDFIITATTDLPDTDWDYSTLISDDKPMLAVYPSHPFAKLKSIRLNEAKDEKFIAVSKDFSMRKYFEDSCMMSGFTPKIILECDYMLRSAMLASEYGIVFTTESGAKAKMLGNAIYIPIEDPPIRRTQAIFFNKKHYMSKAALAFHDFILEHHKEMIDPKNN